MKFVTVMDMWLLVMNGILLGAILYYGKKLLDLIKVTNDEKFDESIKKAVNLENQRIVSIISKELNTFKSAQAMGDHSYDILITELETILGLIKK
jgi:hypothetical protein